MNGTRQLRAADVRQALSFSGEIAGCGDEAQFNSVLATLPDVIGAETALVATCRARAGDVVLEVGDPDVYAPALLAAVGRSGGDHPVLSGDFDRPAHGARRLSDFVGLRQWYRADLFNDFYKPLGMTHELSAQLSWGPAGSSSCLALHRAGGDFSERDRARLGLLAPHLRAARARIDAAALAARRLGLLSRDPGGPDRGTLVLDAAGELVAASPGARDLLGRWFGSAGHTVPAELVGWLDHGRTGRAPGAIEIRHGKRRLEARLLPAEATEGEDLVLLTERGNELSAAHLAAALPITRREAEVLALLAGGDTNDGIAHALGISRHTVVRHVEHLFAKLDVHTRTAATRVALDLRD